MARNHSCSDTWVEAKIVPAIGEVCRRQALQWNSPRDLTAQYARPPQAGHSKPFGQRDAITTARHFSSVPYSASNPASLRGVGARIGWISSKFKNLRQIVLFEIQGFFKDLAYPCTNAAGVLPQ